MGFMDAVKSAFSNYANFNGRASRSEFWYFYLFYIIVAIAISFLAGMVSVLAYLLYAFYLAVIIPFIALAARRMHDNDKSGWFQLIPFYNLYLFIIKGTEGPNRFGDPVV